MRRLSRSPHSTLSLQTHIAKKDYDCAVCEYVFQDNMLRSEPEFDPSSKEINILERRDADASIAMIAMIARLLSVFQ